MAVLLLADHDRGQLTPSVARAVKALAALGQPIDVLVVGAGVGSAAEAAAQLDGVSRVLRAEGAGWDNVDAKSLAALLESLAPDYSHIAAVAAAMGRDVIPRLAARLDVMPVTDVVAIHDANRFDRPIYAGNAIETVRVEGAPVLLTIRPSAFGAAGKGGSAAVEPVAAGPVESLAHFLVEHRTQSDVPDLATASVVVSGGVALGSTHNFEMIERLAHVLGAAVGATRAAVDAGYAPNDWQVGQTGKVIAPDLYIAIGVSGALQHLAGIQGAKTIVAINTDPEAPLVKIADYALIGDLFEVVPALTSALEKRLGR